MPTLMPAAITLPGRGPRRRPRRDTHPRRPSLSDIDWGRVFLALTTVLGLSALLSLHFLPDRVSLRPGQVSDRELRASRTVEYVDHEATEALRDQAAAHVQSVYDPVPDVAADAEQRVKDAFALIRRARLLDATSAARLDIQLHQQVGIAVQPPSLLLSLLRPSGAPPHLDLAERMAQEVVDDAMGRQIRDDQPEDLILARAQVTASVADSLLPHAQVPAVAALARAAIQPDARFDARATTAARLEARRLVAPVLATAFAGDVVLRRGETVTPAVIDELRALGLQDPRLDPGTVAGVVLLTALMVGVVVAYLARYQRGIYGSLKMLSLLALLAALSVLGLRLGSTMLGARLPDTQFGYIAMLCVATTGMLIATLLQPRLALVVVALLAAQAGLILGSGLRFSLMSLLSGVVAVYAVADIRSRGDVVRAGMALGVTNVLLCLAVGRVEGDATPDIIGLVPWAFTTGVLSVALFWLLAALFERPFGITTHLGLLELSDPNRPLLQQFCQLAPGTYTHSVMVGNLAVTAAEAVGADALLCRVGAYYHDLGKMLKPHYFVENQTGRENIHEKLTPSLSALVLTAHVKDGLEMAEDEKLPPVIRQFITEHHGTSLIRYFYHQQMGGDCDGAPPGLEQQFRYGGPKPQSRETAILMLADGVEAASRALDKPTPGRIADVVDKIFAAQLADGQLDECDLTLRDLRGIREAFLRLLTGMLHSRIEYPDLLKAETKAERNGTADPVADRVATLAGCPPDSGAVPGRAAAGDAAA